MKNNLKLSTFTTIFLFVLFFQCCSYDADKIKLEFSEQIDEISEGSLLVKDNLARVEKFSKGKIELWSQSPVLELKLTLISPVSTDWELIINNCTSLTALSFDNVADAPKVISKTELSPTRFLWKIKFPSTPISYSILAQTSDTLNNSPFRFAVLSDIQDKINIVEDIYKLINEDNSVRFVISAGDLTENGTLEQMKTFRNKLGALKVPFYTTKGNHDGFNSPDSFSKIFGRSSFTFTFKNTRFIFADSERAYIDSLIWEWLKEELQGNKAEPVIFVTHYPLIDPSGLRNGGFSSRREAAALIKILALNGVDLLVFGHIHTFLNFSLAGIPAVISGGGGAIPDRFDGIERHFLTIDVDPLLKKISRVALVRVD